MASEVTAVKVYARFRPTRAGHDRLAALAVGETVVLPHPPLISAGAPIIMV